MFKKMEKVKSEENKLVFKAEIDESIANSIRRYTFMVPVLAIDEVEISRNDSALYDETVAHRLGLVPIVTPKVFAKDREEKLKLSTKKEGVVYSGDLKGGVKVAFEKIPITMLDKSQEIQVEATARLGKGSEHSKFLPGLMFYRNLVNIQVDKDCPKEILEACPKGLIVREGDKTKISDPIACDSCGICVETAKKGGKECVKIEPSKELLITIESFGQMDPEDIFKKSVEELKKDLDEVSKGV